MACHGKRIILLGTLYYIRGGKDGQDPAQFPDYGHLLSCDRYQLMPPPLILGT